ncbi:MAG: SDR family oxidoreductase [Acidobacteriota bacterium]
MSPSENHPVVVLTGASSGIGAATAHTLAEGGCRLMLAARRADRLRDLAAELADQHGAEALYRATDVTDREQVMALADATRKHFGRIDVLINNAGVMPLSPLAAGHVGEWEQMVDVNIKGVLWGIHAVLGDMLEQKSGHIINVASVAGHWVYPAFSVYSATKWAVRAISEGLRQETRGKVRVTIISPGAVATELTDSITDEGVIEAFKNADLTPLEPETIARAIRWAIEQPAGVAVNEVIVRPSDQER